MVDYLCRYSRSVDHVFASWCVHCGSRNWFSRPATAEPCFPGASFSEARINDSSSLSALVQWGVTVLYDFSKIYRDISTVRGERSVRRGDESGRLPSSVHDAHNT